MFGIRIELARLEQRDAISNFLLDHYRLEEPLCHSLHLTHFESQKYFGHLADQGLRTFASFVALNDQNQVVGCSLNEIIDFPEKKQQIDCGRRQSRPSIVLRDQWSLAVRKIDDFYNSLIGDVQDLLPAGMKKAMSVIALSVHPDYQNRGIAKRLISTSFELAASRGCQYLYVAATDHRSQGLLEKHFDFHTLKTIGYNDYRDQETGEIVFTCGQENCCVKLLAKELPRPR